MSETYKGFTKNSAGDAPPWSGVENKLHDDIIDNIVTDCLSNSSTTSGHKHWKFYDGYGKCVVRADNTDFLLKIGLTDNDLTGQEYFNIRNIIGTIFGGSSFTVEDNNAKVLLNINAEAENVFIGNTTDGDNVTITVKNVPETFVVEKGNYKFLSINGLSNNIKIGESNSGTAPLVEIGSVNSSTIINSVAPTYFEGGTGDIYTKDVVNLAHSIYGTSSINTHIVYFKSLGNIGMLKIYINAVNDSDPDVYVTLPFRNAMAPAAGECIGVIAGTIYGTQAAIRCTWEDDPIHGTQGRIHFANVDGTAITTDQAFTVTGMIPILVDDPAFVNTIIV